MRRKKTRGWAEEVQNDNDAEELPAAPAGESAPSSRVVSYSGANQHTFRRFLPLASLLAALFLTLGSGLDRYLSFEALAATRSELLLLMEGFATLVVAVFLLIQIAISALSIPAASVATVAGGVLFGPILGTALSVLGQTLGAAIIFLAVRMALRELVVKYAGSAVKRFEAGFQSNAFTYIFILRLLPMIPAWIVNLVPGVTGVPLKTYILATAVGIIPCTAIFSSMGNGLGLLLDAGKVPDWSIFLTPEIALPLMAVTVLSLLPLGCRVYRRHRQA